MERLTFLQKFSCNYQTRYEKLVRISSTIYALRPFWPLRLLVLRPQYYFEQSCTSKKFRSKIEILVKNRNFGQKTKSFSKTEFWSKNKIFLKNRNLVKNKKFGQKSKFWSKIKKSLVKNRNQQFAQQHTLVITYENIYVYLVGPGKRLGIYNRVQVFCLT